MRTGLKEWERTLGAEFYVLFSARRDPHAPLDAKLWIGFQEKTNSKERENGLEGICDDIRNDFPCGAGG